jgi:hypothetical protein
MTTTDRLLSDEELERLATPLSITLERAVAAQDDTHLAWVTEQLDHECLWIYDAYESWIGVLQSHIVKAGGEADQDRALEWVAEYGIRPFVRQYAGADVRERVERLGMRLRSAGSTFDVIEDDEKIRFVCEVFGPTRWWLDPADWQADGQRERVGERYHYPRYGYYGSEFPAFPVLTGARPLTGGRDRLPASLAVEVQFLEQEPIALFGAPLAVLEMGGEATDVVTLDVYKDSANVPAEVYARVGLARPSSSDFAPETTKRIFTDAELERIATPLAIRLENAVAARDWDAISVLTERMDEELVSSKDPLGIVIAGLLSWIAKHYGEDAGEQALVETANVVMAAFIDVVKTMSNVDSIRAWSIAWRSHGSTFWIEEHEDTFVFRGRPLGACHRMWSTAYQPDIERISESRIRYPTFGSFNAPASFHTMREPRGITHGKTGYPIYSCHCVMLHEIYPIQQLGYPLWVEHHPLDDRDGEMHHTHYKDPSKWPAKYYEAVGEHKHEHAIATAG